MTEQATLAGGCFWCLEAAFDELEGVVSVEPGYAGGQVDNPSYEQVCSGHTGHAEVVRVHFDPDVISYDDLLNVFFSIHDPTQLNRQGNDIGTQYRSAIFTHSPQQEDAARSARMRAEDAYDGAIVTVIEPIDKYFAAEDYHRDYFTRNPGQPYCAAVVAPKLAKFRKQYAAKLKRKAR